MELYDAHKNWASRPADERFETLADMHAVVKARDERSRDEDVDLTGGMFRVTDGNVALQTATRNLQTTFWSGGQVFGKLGVPREMLTKLDHNVAETVLNNRLHKYLSEEGGEYKANCLTSATDGPGSPTIIRALHGDRYGRHDERIWDSDVTRLLTQELPDGWRNPVAYEGGQWGADLVPSGLYASDRDMFAFLIEGGDCLDLGGRDQFHEGFFVGNSEVGARRFTMTRFKFRRVCGNNIVWGAEDVSAIALRHTSKAREKAMEFLTNFLRGLGGGSDEAFRQAVASAKERMFALTSVKAEETSIGLAMSKGFTKLDATAALAAIREEEPGAKGTCWDWLQGFTSVARREAHVNDRVKLETQASRAFMPVLK